MRSGDEALRSVRALGLSMAFLALFGSEIRAEIYGFQAISNSSGVSGAVASQLSVEVAHSEDHPGQVLFKFANDITSPYGGNIKGIFFDDQGGLGSIGGLVETSAFTVDFKYPANGQGNFPGGNLLTPAFQATSWTTFNRGQNKIDPGEYLEVVYHLTPMTTFEELLGAIGLGFSGGGPGSLRIGVHVGSIAALPGRDDSDSYVMSLVPVPGAALLASLGISSAGLFLRRKRDLASS